MRVAVQTSAYTTHAMDEESGVLGNLPRSRPGTRSEKRDAAGKRAARAAGSSSAAAGRAAAGKPRSATARAARSAEQRGAKAARPSGQTSRRPAPPPQPEAGSSDPVGAAVRTAASLAGGGFKLANGLTREVLKRLPKP
jgi:hypothetical protein